MGNPQQKQVEEAQQETERLSKAAYGIALPAMGSELSQIHAAIAAGESPGMAAGFGGARTSLMEAGATAERGQITDFRTKDRAAATGGNIGAQTLTPENMGSSIARALYGSRITEAGSQIAERDKLLGLAIGKGSEAGSGALTAFGNELSNIPLMQNYNSTYGNILGALNAAGTIYGAGKQQGWFDQPYTAGGPGGVQF